MKNFTLLLSSLTVFASAFAAVPEVSNAVQKVSASDLELVSASASMGHRGKLIPSKNIMKGTKTPFKAPKKAPGLHVSYEEPAGLFALGASEGGRYVLVGTSYRKGPAYTPLTWTNTSIGATEFEWEVIDDFTTGVPSIYKTQDLKHSESYSMIDGPILYGMDAEGNADVFQYGAENLGDGELSEPNVYYYFGGDTSPQDGIPEMGISTYIYGQNGTDFYGIGEMSYSKNDSDLDPVTGLDPIFTDKQNGFGFSDPKFLGYANYFPTPAAPYLISRIWTWMGVTVNKPTVIEMTLYKVDDDGMVTDEIVAQGSCSAEPNDDNQWFNFDLYSIDEDGLQTDEVIIIDSAVIAEMTFNVDDIEQVFPIAGNGAIFNPDDYDDIPFPMRGSIMIEEEGGLYFPKCPYVFGTDYPDLACAITDWMWMMDALFPWTFAVDGENQVQAPVEGGEVSFNVSSYISLEYFGYDITDYVKGDCDWVDFENATLTKNEELMCQVLNIPVDALPSDVAGRSAIIDVEGIGTSLKLYIHQGEDTGVNVIAVDKNAEYFDLQGRRVANPEKGIYIKKTGNKAEKVLF